MLWLSKQDAFYFVCGDIRMEDSQTNIKWNEFKSYCVSKIHVDNAVKTYLDTCIPVSFNDGILILEVPTSFGMEAISSRYLDQMKKLLPETGFGDDIILRVANSQESSRVSRVSAVFKESFVKNSLYDTGLNPDYVFDSFIVGKSNRFPHAACLAVAEQPGIAYNPLFIWGNVGLGKTHLMQAIGHFILAKDPSKKVLYVSAENFTNEVIQAIRTGGQKELHKRYRELDVLMIDDIQFIAGKEATEEEFFNSFNSMHNAHKQIILTSDRPPKETGLEDRLVSRFSSGLVTDIQSPDFETRVSILQNKAERKKIEIPEDVILFIAENVHSNIRELEGALNRVYTVSEFNGEPLTVQNAAKWMKDLIKEPNGPVTIEKIQQLTAESFGFSIQDLLSKKRTAELALARQIAMYIIRNKTEESLQQIGLCFNKKDHTTVIYACKKVEDLLNSDKRVKMIVDNVVKKL